MNPRASARSSAILTEAKRKAANSRGKPTEMLGDCFQEVFVSLHGGFLLRAGWQTRVRFRLPVFHDGAETPMCVIQELSQIFHSEMESGGKCGSVGGVLLLAQHALQWLQ